MVSLGPQPEYVSHVCLYSSSDQATATMAGSKVG